MTPAFPTHSICSAQGWWSCHYNGVSFWFDRVVFFAVMDDPFDNDRHRVVGVSQERLNLRLNGVDGDGKWFRGYVHEDEFEELGIRLKPDAQMKMIDLKLASTERY